MAKILLDIIGKDKGLSKAIDKSRKSLHKFSTASKKVATNFKNNWVKVSGIIVGTALAINKVNKAASDFEEADAKFKTVFKGMEDSAIKFRKELTKNFGQSRREASKFLGNMQDLLVPLGIAKDKAADLSFEIVKLSTDLGSFNNLPTEKVMLDIQSALVTLKQ